MTTTSAGEDPSGENLPSEIWSNPPKALEPSYNNHRLFNPSAPPPAFNVSSLQAPTPLATGSARGVSAGAGARMSAAAAPSSLALLDENTEASESTLDAAKRKNLPAWIR